MVLGTKFYNGSIYEPSGLGARGDPPKGLLSFLVSSTVVYGSTDAKTLNQPNIGAKTSR